MDDNIKQKIWELAAKIVHNEASDEERKELEELIRKPENNDVFNQVKAFYADLKQLRLLQNTSPNDSWKRVSDYFKRQKIRLAITFMKYAAIVVVAFLAGSVVNEKLSLFTNDIQSYTEVKVPLGQMSEITLTDGTHVWLNSGTTLQYACNFGKDVREVKLNGEAFFDVEKSDIPFIVEMKKNKVEVLGTTFSAISYEGENFNQVTLVEGQVKLNDALGQSVVVLEPEQQITFTSELENYWVREVDTRFYQSWTEGKIVFDDEPLGFIARRLERWYNVEIQFESEEAEDIQFSGTILKNKPLDQIIQAFSLLLPVEIDHQINIGEKDVIIISKI